MNRQGGAIAATRQRIVVAEDNAPARDMLVRSLERAGFEPVVATDGLAALRATRQPAALAIVDLGLPVLDGFHVLRTARGEGINTPIIVLTGRADEVDRVICFELGADDYVLKPYYMRELMCRVHAILRRCGDKPEQMSNAAPLCFGQMEIDEAAREVRVDGRSVGMRPKEFSLLLVLARNNGIALSRKTLIERAWGFDYAADERAVDGHIRQIRHRLEDEFGLDPLIRTIYGFGYKFNAR